MSVATSDFKKGMAIYIDGEVYQITDHQHVKPGKGGAFVRTTLKRLRTGNTIERTFRSGEKFEPAFVETVEYQFLFRQGSEVVLMDLDSYEQINVPEANLGDGAQFLKEDMKVNAMVVGEETLGYSVPNFVELEVAHTDPNFKGDTATGGSKPATLESGAVVQVPFFIEVGDVLKIDTRTREYLERVKK